MSDRDHPFRDSDRVRVDVSVRLPDLLRAPLTQVLAEASAAHEARRPPEWWRKMVFKHFDVRHTYDESASRPPEVARWWVNTRTAVTRTAEPLGDTLLNNVCFLGFCGFIFCAMHYGVPPLSIVRSLIVTILSAVGISSVAHTFSNTENSPTEPEAIWRRFLWRQVYWGIPVIALYFSIAEHIAWRQWRKSGYQWEPLPWNVRKAVRAIRASEAAQREALTARLHSLQGALSRLQADQAMINGRIRSGTERGETGTTEDRLDREMLAASEARSVPLGEPVATATRALGAYEELLAQYKQLLVAHRPNDEPACASEYDEEQEQALRGIAKAAFERLVHALERAEAVRAPVPVARVPDVETEEVALEPEHALLAKA